LRPEVKNRALTPAGLTDLLASSMRDAGALVAKGQDDEIALGPVLVTHEHKIGAVLVGPIARDADVRRIAHNPDFILDGRHNGEQDFLELDIALLDAALTRIASLRAAGQPAAVGTCVH